MMSDTLGGVAMTDEQAFAELDRLDDDARPTTIPRIAAIIRAGCERGETDIQTATRIAEFIFEGEPKRASTD